MAYFLVSPVKPFPLFSGVISPTVAPKDIHPVSIGDGKVVENALRSAPSVNL
jgi:hypothetical protein